MDFSALIKLPRHPAARILTAHGVSLQTPLEASASASAAELLTELQDKSALIDMLQLLAHALPAREATWWGCLSARDALAGRATPAVRAAEAWVRKPDPTTRAEARAAFDAASNDDNTALAAMAACFADGTMGPGEYEDYPAPPGAVGHAVHGLTLLSLYHDEDAAEVQGQTLLARGLDIAAGGSGQIETSQKEESLP